MAHPVVIMAYEKSDAIGAAVAALEESGLEVVVLNTAKAKLVNFLGALAGATDEDDEDAESEDETKEKEDGQSTSGDEEDSSADKNATTGSGQEEAETTDKKEVTTEGTIEDEKVLIKIVEGSSAVLYPSTINIGAKTVYNLNESSFSFWPSATGNEPIKGGINLSFDGIEEFIQVTFSEQVQNPPVLELGADLVAKLKA